jgi:hypothetical protein
MIKFKMYKNVNSGTSMISFDSALDELRELGHHFAVGLAERGHHTSESDLMSGLAAYHILDLKGTSARLDAAHDMVFKHITDIAFERARASAGD